MKPVTGLLMLALVAAVATFGFLYYQEKKDDVNIELEVPKVTVD